MEQKQIELIEACWYYVLKDEHLATSIFYERLFEIDPHLRVVFKDDSPNQRRNLVLMATFVIHKLGNIEEIIDDFEMLGIRHQIYAVIPEHFRIAGEALIHMLKTVIGEPWNTQCEEAWTLAYQTVSNTVIEAAEASLHDTD